MHAWLYFPTTMIVASTVVNAQCDPYVVQPRQNFTNYTCTIGDTSGGTPLGFQCIEMTYPEFTADINDYPCRTVNDVAGRHIEVLVSKLNISCWLCNITCNIYRLNRSNR